MIFEPPALIWLTSYNSFVPLVSGAVTLLIALVVLGHGIRKRNHTLVASLIALCAIIVA